jgi:hypothetical protein
MKNVKMTIFLSLIVMIGYAQKNEKYEQMMVEKTEKLQNVKSAQEMLDLANQFERISAVEKEEWLPVYYAAFCYINMTFMEGQSDQKDALLDKAQKLIDQALEIGKNESELHVLQGFLHQGRIQVDPMNRGMQYSMKANESFGEAKAKNPDNPRIYFLQGQNLLYTPEAFGGGAKAACPLLQTAVEKYHIFVPENDYSPNWGKTNAEALAQRSCSE